MKQSFKKNLNRNLTVIIPIKASDFSYLEQVVPLVRENISPKSIVVISSEEIKDKCSTLGIDFCNENELIKGLSFIAVKEYLNKLGIITNSTGWYLQQFIKLGFSSISPTEYYVSWDADMLPIRKISLFDKNNKPFFTLKKEYCKRYFITIKRLLGLNKNRNESYIAEHMVFYKPFVKELIKEIEQTPFQGNSFWEKILTSTLPDSACSDAFAFSEFETYGTWATAKHPDFYSVRRLNTLRHAKYFLSSPSSKDIKWAAKSFDTLSFEHFDEPKIPNFIRSVLRPVIKFSTFLRITSIFFSKTKLKEFDWFFGQTTCYEKSSADDKDVSNVNKTKILFDTSMINSFADKGRTRSGIYWVSFNILKHLALRSDVKLYLYSPDMIKTKAFIKCYEQEIPGLNLFSGDLRRMDVYLSSLNQIPSEIKNTKIPCFTIIHDCIPMVLPEHFEVCKGWFPALLESFTNQDYCFSNSNYTKKDFLKYCPQLDSKKIITIPLSTNLPYKPNQNLTEEIRRKYGIPKDKKYLFSLCSLEPRKNLIRSVKCFIDFIEKNKIDDLIFVLGGGAYDGFIERFEKEVPGYNKYKDKIIRAGYIDDEDMEVLYSNAEWFVYTSRYEGFGMPPLEAMACGTAVITSNNSSLPEVVGNAGIKIDWDSDEQHIAAYEKYYFDTKYRKTMAKKGLERSKLFSWDKATSIMVNKFQEIKYNPERKSLFLQGAFSYSPTIKKVYLFDAIPLFKTKLHYNVSRWLLFGFIPVLKIKHEPQKTKSYLLCVIPFTRITNKYGIFKLRIFGLPILKIKNKR